MIWGRRFGRHYVTIKTRADRAYFSERNRIRTRVIPLAPRNLLRLVIRTDSLRHPDR